MNGEKEETKLNWGDRVETTEYAIKAGLFVEHKSGIYLGERFDLIYIAVEGKKQSSKFHKDYWQKESNLTTE